MIAVMMATAMSALMVTAMSALLASMVMADDPTRIHTLRKYV